MAESATPPPPAPRKQVRYFRSFEAMRDVLLEAGSRRTPAERLVELNRLNRLAYPEARQYDPARNYRTRLQLYVPQVGESISAFYARAAAERQQWISSRRNFSNSSPS